jgi:dihydrofolate synthase/folylpolyglutamate synthase
MSLTTFQEAQAALAKFVPHQRQRVADTPEYIQRFLQTIGDPQDRLPAIHIAGTSGKSSTAYYAAALLQAAGKKVGLLVSPHVLQLNERVQVNGQPLPEKIFCQELELFLALVHKSQANLTYAEVMYAFAFWEFARQAVDSMVIEVGRGGLFDATNVMNRPDKLCIITDISRDHVAALGTTLEAIAQHKAGIIGYHNTVFCYRQAPEIVEQIVARARQAQADLHLLVGPQVTSHISALPSFQQRNFALALQAVSFWLERAGRPPLSDLQIAQAAQQYIPGRLERIVCGSRVLIVDGAHNQQKLQVLGASMRQQYPNQRTAVLVAFGESSRNLPELLAAVGSIAHHIIATTVPAESVDSHHFRLPMEIVAACATQGGSSVEAIANIATAFGALMTCPEPVLLVTGSLYLPQALVEAGCVVTGADGRLQLSAAYTSHGSM